MKKNRPNKIKIMVASTVYGFEDQIESVVAELETLGYEFARQLFKNIKTRDDTKKLFDIIEIKKNNVFDFRCLEVYDYVIKNTVFPIASRNGNWVQPFYRLDEMKKFILTQFSDKELILKLLMQKEANNV